MSTAAARGRLRALLRNPFRSWTLRRRLVVASVALLAVLGVAKGYSEADIKKAFRQKASFYHPDRNTAPDAAQRFAEVQKAYEVLSDDDARQAYDDNRRRNLLDDPLQTAQEIWQAYSARILSHPSAL